MNKNIFLIISLLVTFTIQAQHKIENLPVASVVEKFDFQTRFYPGKVVAVAQVNITSRVNGEIIEVCFNNGDIVHEGQLLYRLDSIKYQATVKNAEAKVAEYKARMLYAEGNYQRNKQLSVSNAISLDSLENSLSERNAYQALLNAAEADLLSAKDDLAHCQIIAPITGKLSTTNFTKGNYITPSSGTLVTLVQTSPIRVCFSISNHDYLNMFEGKGHIICKKGKISIVLSNGKNYEEEGHIEYIDNHADNDTDTIQVFAIFPNKERILKPNGTISISLQNKTGVPYCSISPSAIMQDVKGSFVWVVSEENKVSKRYVIRGRISNDFQFIESGLKIGEKVIIDGTHKVSDGDTIVPIMQER